jgi:flagellar hook protein FlgE
MSLFNTLGTGASGMGAASMGLAVIGDNIANVGTTGYKSSRAYFADVFPEFVGTGSGPAKLGRGAMLGGIGANFGQGALESTGGALDFAVSGAGFFPVRSNGETFYTRDGSFKLDKDGFVTTLGGGRVQGYQAQDGVLSTQVGDLQLDLSDVLPEPTSTIVMNANLTADVSDLLSTPPVVGGMTFDGATVDIADATAAADFSTSVSIVDELGLTHEVTVLYEATAGGDWDWTAVVDGGEVDTDGDGLPNGTRGRAFEIASGTVSFTGPTLSGFTQTNTTAAWNFTGAAAQSFTFDMGIDASGVPTSGSLTQVGQESTVTAITHDGRRGGSVLDLEVASDGTINAVFDNGSRRAVGAVALAQFAAEGELERAGGNLFRSTWRSGEALLGTAGQSGLGSVVSRSLERSNTDLEGEFVAMIQAQRSYQANAGVIRAADETLQELVRLV